MRDQNKRPTFNFNAAKLPDITSGLTGYVLTDRQGNIWTDASNEREAHGIVTQAVTQLSPEGVSG